MDVVLGLRVVRGPDWKWGDQDGGEGQVGTVAEVETVDESVDGKTLARAVIVQWDGGNRCNYRCGVEGKYDLRIFDNATAGVKHNSIICDSCRQNGITGIRWKCIKCYDFDLCTSCYNAGKHSLEHEFSRYDVVDGQSCRVPPRITARRVAAKGLFPNAEVVRGQDWLWADQDGGLGKSGILLEVRGWENDTYRSVAEVEWKDIQKKNVYRVGHKGKVDLKCKESASGGYYYPEHLPILGAPYQPPLPPQPHKFQSGDSVKVQLELEIFKMMQEGHGGWNDQMAEGLTEVGTVQTVLDSGDVRIRFPSNRTWTINPDAITKVPQHSGGDVVRILDDIATVHDLQEGHGGWVDDMALSLGQVGRVIKVFPTGDVRVAVNGRTWTYNPLCMEPAPGENPPEAPPPDLETEDIGLHLKLLSLLENPAVIVAAAASGDVGTIRDFLQKHPKEVNAKAAGKAAIHCASVAGNVPVLKVLLEFKADLEIGDEDGDRPLHLCAYSDEDEAAKLLMDAGANVNSRNQKGATPLIISAVKGHYSVLRLLASHPSIHLHEQDSDGDTALHCAVLAQKNESVAVLLDSGTDPTLLNFRLFTPIHEAARIGFLPAMEHFIRRFPQYINLRKDDGYTPLHLASLNDHLDVVTILADLDICEIDAATNLGQTALHLAVHQGHSRITERLVGFGANLDAQDSDGDTPLHVTLVREAVDPLSADTPQLKKVRQYIQDDSVPHASATVACFLVQEGAGMYLRNKKGSTPLQLCSPDVAALLTTFAERKVHFPFHGSLRTSSAMAGVSQSPSSVKPQAAGHEESASKEATAGSSNTATVSSIQQKANATVGCGLPPPPPRGSLGNLTSSEEGAVVTFQCNPGLVPSRQMMSVCTNTRWDTNPAELVCRADCGDPSPPMNGFVMAYGSTLEGSQIVFQCSPGFVPSQQMMSVCAANGSWTPDPAELVCRVGCGIPIINNGAVNYTTTVEGSTATYQCGVGLIPVGVMTAVCMGNGKWDPDPITIACRLPGQATCGVPPSPSNGFVDFTNVIEGSEATFRCDTGPEMTAICTASGEWVPNPGDLDCVSGLSTAAIVGISVTISSIVSFIAGLLVALGIAYFYIQQQKTNQYTPNETAPTYEDLSVDARRDIELKENVAYNVVGQ